MVRARLDKDKISPVHQLYLSREDYLDYLERMNRIFNIWYNGRRVNDEIKVSYSLLKSSLLNIRKEHSGRKAKNSYSNWVDNCLTDEEGALLMMTIDNINEFLMGSKRTR